MSYDPTPSFGNEDTYSPDNLLAGDFPVATEEVTIESGAGALTRGTVLGKKTATSKYWKSASAAGDGSETPTRILAQDVDATAADVVATVYQTGEFSQRAITLGTGHTVASVKDGLAARGIFLRPTVA